MKVYEDMGIFCDLYSPTGELAQMVERPLCMREVPGSIPGFSIFFFLCTYKTHLKKDLGNIIGTTIFFIMKPFYLILSYTRIPSVNG